MKLRYGSLLIPLFLAFATSAVADPEFYGPPPPTKCERALAKVRRAKDATFALGVAAAKSAQKLNLKYGVPTVERVHRPLRWLVDAVKPIFSPREYWEMGKWFAGFIGRRLELLDPRQWPPGKRLLFREIEMHEMSPIISEYLETKAVWESIPETVDLKIFGWTLAKDMGNRRWWRFPVAAGKYAWARNRYYRFRYYQDRVQTHVGLKKREGKFSRFWPITLKQTRRNGRSLMLSPEVGFAIVWGLFELGFMGADLYEERYFTDIWRHSAEQQVVYAERQLRKPNVSRWPTRLQDIYHLYHEKTISREGAINMIVLRAFHVANLGDQDPQNIIAFTRVQAEVAEALAAPGIARYLDDRLANGPAYRNIRESLERGEITRAEARRMAAQTVDFPVDVFYLDLVLHQAAGADAWIRQNAAFLDGKLKDPRYEDIADHLRAGRVNVQQARLLVVLRPDPPLPTQIVMNLNDTWKILTNRAITALGPYLESLLQDRRYLDLMKGWERGEFDWDELLVRLHKEETARHLFYLYIDTKYDTATPAERRAWLQRLPLFRSVRRLELDGQAPKDRLLATGHFPQADYAEKLTDEQVAMLYALRLEQLLYERMIVMSFPLEPGEVAEFRQQHPKIAALRDEYLADPATRDFVDMVIYKVEQSTYLNSEDLRDLLIDDLAWSTYHAMMKVRRMPRFFRNEQGRPEWLTMEHVRGRTEDEIQSLRRYRMFLTRLYRIRDASKKGPDGKGLLGPPLSFIPHIPKTPLPKAERYHALFFSGTRRIYLDKLIAVGREAGFAAEDPRWERVRMLAIRDVQREERLNQELITPAERAARIEEARATEVDFFSQTYKPR